MCVCSYKKYTYNCDIQLYICNLNLKNLSK